MTTAGQYIFCDDDTPVTPVPTNLWSRDWITDELEGATLGEALDAVRAYSLGAPIGPVPLPGLLGSADCLANGEVLPGLPVTLLGGFPVDCFAGVPPQTPPSIDVLDPANWCWWAGVVVRTYTDPAGARAQVAARLGVVNAGFEWPQPNVILPALFALIPAAPAPVVICVAGTDNTIQWVAQIGTGIGPPRDRGAFATHPVWWADADFILNALLAEGANATQDIVIVGHSLGAGIASVLAARLRLGNPARRIQLLVLGYPRPGDIRLIRILNTCQVVSLGNEGDIVLALPSNYYDIPPALRFLTNTAYPAGSPFWEFSPNRFRIAWDGTVAQGAADPGLTPALNAIWLWSIGRGPFPDLSAHLQSEYERRLCTPAPAPIVWLDSWDLAQADGDAVPVWPNRVDPTNSPQQLSAVVQPAMALEQQQIIRAVLFTGNDTLTLPTPVGGSQWALYAVLGIYAFPPTWQNKARSGVPLSSLSLAETVDCTWRGSGRGGPTLDVISVPDEATVAFADAQLLHLVRITCDLAGGTLEASLEGPGTLVSSSSSLTAPIVWKFVGGCFPTPCGPIGATGGFYLCEMLLYASLLSAGDDASVQDYLRRKWLRAAIATEGGDLLTTEGGNVLITE